jgi:hypothetical protein
MLSPAQMNALADRINAAVDLPFVNEAIEKQMIMNILQQLGSVVGNVLSPDQMAALGDTNKGVVLDAAVKSNLQNDLMKQLSGKLDLGVFNSALVSSVSKMIAETLVNAMQKGNKL